MVKQPRHYNDVFKDLFLKQIFMASPGPFPGRIEAPNLRTDLVFSLLPEQGFKETQFVSESVNHLRNSIC
jgi:hypothetical protein